MTPEQIKEKVLSYKWEHFFDRPLGPFMVSCFKGGGTRAFMKKTGVDAEFSSILFQNGAVYKSNEVLDNFALVLREYEKRGGSIFDVVRNCEKYHETGKKLIADLVRSKKSMSEKLEELYEIITQVVSYIWLTHGFEYIYETELKKEVAKYFKGDIDKIVGDLSFPTKKNAHHYFEEALRSSMSISEVQKKYAWIKARDGFSPGFSIDELEQERKHLLENPKKENFIRPSIPAELSELVKISQELVYFRTLRTDIMYEFMYLARPILEEVAEHYKLKIEDLKNYNVHDLISGKPDQYEFKKFCVITYHDNFAMFHEPVLILEEIKKMSEFKGTPAFKGKVRGIAKVAMNAYETEKIVEGDILVAPTTAPSYIMAMKRASAFITDEGGITSHAAIVAREMKKPCIIGTKIATKVLKDGDMVEVDANAGIVKILNK